jgi:hypothetical protein
MLLDPWEKWIVMALPAQAGETGPASKIAPWLIIALLLLMTLIGQQPQENEEEPNQ